MATGTAERDAAMEMADEIPGGSKRVTLGADRAYDTAHFVEQLQEFRHPACGAEHSTGVAPLMDAPRATMGMPQPKKTQARRGSLRLDQDHRLATKTRPARTSRLDVHVRRGRLQSDPDAQPHGAACLNYRRQRIHGHFAAANALADASLLAPTLLW